MLSLARRAIKEQHSAGSILNIDKSAIDELKKDRGVFVTLTIQGRLRGCIGHIEPVQPLYLDIIDNAVSAAFKDPRFDPLSKDEYDQIKIEISILTIPRILKYGNTGELLAGLEPFKDGVIIKKGRYQATYLPQVWEELSQKETFLSSLCIKAGLPQDEWQKGGLEVRKYSVEKFEEQ